MTPTKFSTGYLTPQPRKTNKNQVKDVETDNFSPLADINDSIFHKIMSCPIKKKLVLNLIASEKDNIEAFKKNLKEKDKSKQNSSSLQKIQKKQVCESPTQLMRRRALENQNRNSPLIGNIGRSNSENSHSSRTLNSNASPIPFETLLDGVVAYVEVKSKGQDRSDGVKALMSSMGAVVKDTFTKDVTHVVFKDGSYTTFQKAKLMNKPLVSVLWIEGVRSSGIRVPEKNFPALGTEAYDHNISKICSQMQKEYEEIIKDELQKSLVTGTPLPSTKALIDRRRTMMSPNLARSSIYKSFSEDISSQDNEIQQIINRARINSRMTMDFVKSSNDESEMTSDDDDSRCDAIINGYVITKKDRLCHPLTDLTNDDLSNMDLTNIESVRPVLTPNMKKNLFNIEKAAFRTQGDLIENTVNENESLDILYDLHTPKINRHDVSSIEETPLLTQNDSIYRRRTKSLAKTRNTLTKSSKKTTSECRTSTNKNQTPSLHILSRNSCNASPLTPIIHQNIIIQKANNSSDVPEANNNSDVPVANNIDNIPEKSSTTDMSSLQLSSEGQKTRKMSQRKSDSVEKILGSDMSSLKISAEKSSTTDMSSLQLASDKATSNTNMSSVKVSSSNKTSLSSDLSSLKLTCGKTEEKSSSGNMSSLQLTSGGEISDERPTKTSETVGGLKEVFKRPSSIVNNGSFNSPNNSISLPSTTINNILVRLDTPPIPSDDNVTKRRRRRTLFTPKECSCDENHFTKQKAKSTTRVNRRQSLFANEKQNTNNETLERDESNNVESSSKKANVNKNPTSKLEQNSDVDSKSSDENKKPDDDSPVKKSIPTNTPTENSTSRRTRTRNISKTVPITSNKNDKTTPTVLMKSYESPKENSKKLTSKIIKKRKSPVINPVSQEDLTFISPTKKSKYGDSSTKDPMSSPEKTRRIRKLYNPENVIELATIRASKLSDDDERKHKRLQNHVKKTSDGVIITCNLKSKNNDQKNNSREVEEKCDDSDDSEIDVPIKATRKKKVLAEPNVTINGYGDEQRELAREILGRNKRQPSNKRTSKSPFNGSSCSSSSNKNSDNEDDLKNISTKSKTLNVSKSTVKTTRKRQSQRILSAVKKANFSSPENHKVPVTPRSNRRSTMEFQSKDEMSAKRKLKIDKLKRPSIVCTKLHKDNIMIFNQIVKKLGKFVIEDEVSRKTTHLVAGEPKRTINMLRAMAMGCWILKYEWVLKSLDVGRWLPEEDYEETDFSSAVQESRLHRQAFGPTYTMDIFKECGQIYVARGSVPRSSDLKELINLCQGKVTNILRNAVIVVGGYINQSNVTCVEEIWVLDSITKYKKMPFKNYLIKSNNGVMI